MRKQRRSAMAETNETCIGNMITKSAWPGGRFGDICTGQSGVQPHRVCTALLYLRDDDADDDDDNENGVNTMRLDELMV